MATRAEKLRRRQRRKEKKLQRQAQSAFVARAENLVVVNPRGEIKMSEALMGIIQPEWNACESEDAMHKLLTLGMPPETQPCFHSTNARPSWTNSQPRCPPTFAQHSAA